MNIFKRKPNKSQYIIEHENRLANYGQKVNKQQEKIYENGIINHFDIYMLSIYHYWFAFSSFYTKLRATSPLEMISFEEAVNKYSEIHNNRINNITKTLSEQYEDLPVSLDANGNLKILLEELSQYSMVSLDDNIEGSIDVLSLLK